MTMPTILTLIAGLLLAASGVQAADATTDGSRSSPSSGTAPQTAEGGMPGGRGGSGGALDFTTLDSDGDGKLTPQEFEVGSRAVFDLHDLNGDGAVTRDELRRLERD